MKKYMMITTETLEKLSHCFTDSDELAAFIQHMEAAMEEIRFMSVLRDRVESEHSVVVLLRQICVFSLLCREHAELVIELMKAVDCKEVTEEEMKRIKEQE